MQYIQVLENLVKHEARYLTWINSSVSSSKKQSSYKLILSIKLNSNKNNEKFIFLLLKKNYEESYNLIFKKKFHIKAKIIVVYLLAY